MALVTRVAPSAVVHGLAPALTSFVGREAEVADVTGLLGEYRLVTVTGPGGVGKTRLAGEVARHLAGEFADGAWLAELATVAEPGLVPTAVAVSLGLRQASGSSLAASMLAALRRRQILLVLDNCEHVLAAAAALCQSVLPFADDIRILATSREPLGLAGEARYRLAPLALPDSPGTAGEPDPAGEPDAAGQSAAVRLFADRARQADSRFAIGPESAAAVAQIVRRLDGIPLAIELAAARVEALGVTQLADRLDDRLLAGTGRQAPDRHRSLAATAAWSYQLLDEPERAVFRRLAVFPGPFTLTAAEAVAGPGAGPAVLRLVDCSMLVPPRTGPDGRARYLMLETLRGYALSRLTAEDEETAASATLAGHALWVAEQAAAGLATSTAERGAAEWLDAEDAIVHQGLGWALEHDPQTAVRLALALAPWWSLRGRYAEGDELLSAAARLVPEGGPQWCSARVWLGRLATGTDEAAGLRHFTAARQALAATAPAPDLVQALCGCADCLLNLGRIDEAATTARQALVLARKLDYPEGEARALCWVGASAYYAGDHRACLSWWQQAQQIQPDGLPGSLVRRSALFLAIALLDAGDYPAAERHCSRALSLARPVGAVFDQADGLMIMANIALRTGRRGRPGRI